MKLKMHCDDKRTIFALNQKLQETKEEKKILKKILNEKNTAEKTEIEKKLLELDRFIEEVQTQLSETK
ncbi:MAG: hypothetical protein GTN35_02915 [Nitrososphaeria archaeon]|nr:hypothetical protein [Nitrosopumilaceae archaeon]NIP09484.1 hypothetical protein [Nitrosopumilaceae archaeon]NIP91339.1 hypothetical protein [Nitrososphaeria archaeon]NIS94349.1 hypothetical protein [Nitrosopumilaceae archaeon]